MQKNYCQSCGMPMTEENHFGTNSDGGKNSDYCSYCYQNGTFTQELTMDEMIEFCAKHTEEWGMKISREEATLQMKEYFPKLKRWRTEL